MEDEYQYERFLNSVGLYLRSKHKNRRSIWKHGIFRQHHTQGEFHNLLQEMHLSDPESHVRYLRMSKERFDLLLSEVRQYENIAIVTIYIMGWSFTITSTLFKHTKAAAERLALTIRFLATGNSQVIYNKNKL